MPTSLRRFVLSMLAMTLLLAACGSSINQAQKEALFEKVQAQLTTLWNKEQDDIAKQLTLGQVNDVRQELEEELQQEDIQKALNKDDEQTIDQFHQQLDSLRSLLNFEEKRKQLVQEQKEISARQIQDLRKELEQFKSFQGFYERQQEAITDLENQSKENDITKIEQEIQKFYDVNQQIRVDLQQADFQKLQALIQTIEDATAQETLRSQVAVAEKAWYAALAQTSEEANKSAEEPIVDPAQEELDAKHVAEKTPAPEQQDGQVPTEQNEQAKAPVKNIKTDQQPTSKTDTRQSDKAKTEPSTKATTPKYVGNGVIIASKKYPLPASHAPGESGQARSAFNQMVAAAKQDGVHLTAFSTYRSYNYQVDLYNRYVERDGQAAADRYSAKPGYSEHQTGLAFDIGEVGQESHFARASFANTKGGQWLAGNAHNYGFILRYPQGKESVTGYMYEAWHYRYVGSDLAKKIYKQNATLEEYFGI